MSTSPIITVFVKLDYWDAYRSNVILTIRVFRKVLWGFGIAGICLLLAWTLAYLRPRPEADWQQIIRNSNAVLWAFAVPILFVYIVPLLSARRIVRDERVKAGVRYQLSAEGIHVETSVARSDWQWSAIRQVVETRHGFLLFTTPIIANTLPLRCFAQEADIVDARELFRANVLKTKLRLVSS